jgi:hypothetical protein
MNSAAPFPRPSRRSPSQEAITGIWGKPSTASARPPKADTLKIIVVGTPKTGNTWVKHLLAEAYGLTPVRLKPEFDPAEAEAAGPRWISHQHFLPQHDLLAWGAAHNTIFVSAVRHPGDVLVSLWHHMQSRRDHGSHSQDDLTQAATMLLDGADVAGDSTRNFVEHGFHLYLNLSIAWLGLPGVRSVRYEDLWECPVEALRALTASILPVSDERLRFALCACELSMMQALLDPKKMLVRRGGTGGWRAALPTDTKQRLASLAPYPAQFAALGYTMNEGDPANTPQPKHPSVVGPFGADNTFADGMPASPVVMRAYFDLSSAQRERWPDPRSIEGDSFFNWLNRSAAADSESSRTPVVTELAHYIYSIRQDVRQAFPHVFGADRSAYYDWFLFTARQEYGLAPCFVAQNPFSETRQFSDGTTTARVLVRAYLDLPESMRRRWANPTVAGLGSFLTWLNSPAAADPAGGALAPAITELGAYLHSIRADVRAVLPDLYGAHRVGFTKWFLSSAVREYALDRAFTLPVVRSWAESADRVPPHIRQLVNERRTP